MRLTNQAVILLCALPLGLGGCGDPKKLTRDRAKDLIQTNVAFRNVETEIPTGPNVYGMNLSHVSAIYNGLQSRGFIVLRENQFTTPFRHTKHSVELTEAAKKYMIRQEPNVNDKNLIMVYLRACEREVTEISGIEQPTERAAKIHFKYKSSSPTPLAEFDAIVSSSMKKTYTKGDCSAEVKVGAVEVALFDDGWRIKGE